MTGECELHDVGFDKCSVCPVCEAVYFERERIIELLESVPALKSFPIATVSRRYTNS